MLNKTSLRSFYSFLTRSFKDLNKVVTGSSHFLKKTLLIQVSWDAQPVETQVDQEEHVLSDTDDEVEPDSDIFS